MDTSANRCSAICHGGFDRGIKRTIASVTPAKRYALLSERTIVQRKPKINTQMPKTSTCGAKYAAATAPTSAPRMVPRKRCHETANAEPREDCVITNVVIGAQ